MIKTVITIEEFLNIPIFKPVYKDVTYLVKQLTTLKKHVNALGNCNTLEECIDVIDDIEYGTAFFNEIISVLEHYENIDFYLSHWRETVTSRLSVNESNEFKQQKVIDILSGLPKHK